jgi:hypothetical protein
MVLKLTTVNFHDVKSVALDLLRIYRQMGDPQLFYNIRFTGFLGVTRNNSLSLAIQHTVFMERSCLANL